ncbi:MAG: isocitrate lyase/PEP mutase family protein [Saccharolobus sp.]
MITLNMGNIIRSKKDGPKQLRLLLEKEEIILAPGAYDVLSAKMIEATGFKMVYMSGFGTAASKLGYPDVGLVTMSEMVDTASKIAEAVNIPVVGDGDTGYGNPINVIRTVQSYENAGIAGIQIEDQVFPKKCGHISGKQVVSIDEMVAKIRAACDARRSKDFVIIARTDAIAVEGIDSAIARAKAYSKAGADLIFVEAPENLSQVEKIAKELQGIPLVYNWAEGGKSPQLDIEVLRKLGFKIVIFPVSTLFAAAKAIKEVLESIKQNGTPLKVMNKLISFQEFLNFIGLSEVYELEKKYIYN